MRRPRLGRRPRPLARRTSGGLVDKAAARAQRAVLLTASALDREAATRARPRPGPRGDEARPRTGSGGAVAGRLLARRRPQARRPRRRDGLRAKPASRPRQGLSRIADGRFEPRPPRPGRDPRAGVVLAPGIALRHPSPGPPWRHGNFGPRPRRAGAAPHRRPDPARLPLMAEIEEAEHGRGSVRARSGSRAPPTPSAIRPGAPTASSPSAGRRSRRSPAGSTPSCGRPRRNSSPRSRARTTTTTRSPQRRSSRRTGQAAAAGGSRRSHTGACACACARRRDRATGCGPGPAGERQGRGRPEACDRRHRTDPAGLADPGRAAASQEAGRDGARPQGGVIWPAPSPPLRGRVPHAVGRERGRRFRRGRDHLDGRHVLQRPRSPLPARSARHPPPQRGEGKPRRVGRPASKKPTTHPRTGRTTGRRSGKDSAHVPIALRETGGSRGAASPPNQPRDANESRFP